MANKPFEVIALAVITSEKGLILEGSVFFVAVVSWAKPDWAETTKTRETRKAILKRIDIIFGAEAFHSAH